MNKETARSLFMDYLYDELEADQKNELDHFLSQNPELKKELDELAEVRTMIVHLPVQDPAEQLVVVQPKRDGFTYRWRHIIETLLPKNGFAKAGFALASVLVVFVILGALSKMNITVNEEGFNVAFGNPPEVVQQGFTPEQVNYLLQQMKQENALVVEEAVQAVQKNQTDRLEKTLINFADYMEQQRQEDLQMINSGLLTMEKTYYNRFRKTDQVLGEIIQTVSNRN
jgi:hypothetical protein